VAEEVVGNGVRVGQEVDRKAVPERDQDRGELVGGEPGSGLGFGDGGLEEAPDDDSEAGVALGESLGGGGVPHRLAPEVDQQQERVPIADAGLASGILNASQQVSVAIGTAALASAAAARTKALAGLGQDHLQALTGGFHLGWAIGAGAVVAGALVAILSLRPKRRLAEVLAVRDREPAEVEQEAA
jgi:hypothetical protein